MEKDHEKPAKLKTPQNPQAPQDESPLSQPEKSRKDIAADKKMKKKQSKE